MSKSGQYVISGHARQILSNSLSKINDLLDLTYKNMKLRSVLVSENRNLEFLVTIEKSYKIINFCLNEICHQLSNIGLIEFSKTVRYLYHGFKINFDLLVNYHLFYFKHRSVLNTKLNENIQRLNDFVRVQKKNTNTSSFKADNSQKEDASPTIRQKSLIDIISDTQDYNEQTQNVSKLMNSIISSAELDAGNLVNIIKQKKKELNFEISDPELIMEMQKLIHEDIKKECNESKYNIDMFLQSTESTTNEEYKPSVELNELLKTIKWSSKKEQLDLAYQPQIYICDNELVLKAKNDAWEKDLLNKVSEGHRKIAETALVMGSKLQFKDVLRDQATQTTETSLKNSVANNETIEELTAKLQKVETVKKRFHDLYDKKSIELNDIESKFGILKKSYFEMESKLAIREKEIERLEKYLQEVKDDRDHCLKKIDKKSDMVSSLLNQLNVKQETATFENDRFYNLIKANRDLSQKIDIVNQSIIEIRMNAKTTKELSAGLEREILDLRDQIEKANNDIDKENTNFGKTVIEKIAMIEDNHLNDNSDNTSIKSRYHKKDNSNRSIGTNLASEAISRNNSNKSMRKHITNERSAKNIQSTDYLSKNNNNNNSNREHFNKNIPSIEYLPNNKTGKEKRNTLLVNTALKNNEKSLKESSESISNEQALKNIIKASSPEQKRQSTFLNNGSINDIELPNSPKRLTSITEIDKIEELESPAKKNPVIPKLDLQKDSKFPKINVESTYDPSIKESTKGFESAKTYRLLSDDKTMSDIKSKINSNLSFEDVGKRILKNYHNSREVLSNLVDLLQELSKEDKKQYIQFFQNIIKKNLYNQIQNYFIENLSTKTQSNKMPNKDYLFTATSNNNVSSFVPNLDSKDFLALDTNYKGIKTEESFFTKKEKKNERNFGIFETLEKIKVSFPTTMNKHTSEQNLHHKPNDQNDLNSKFSFVPVKKNYGPGSNNIRHNLIPNKRVMEDIYKRIQNKKNEFEQQNKKFVFKSIDDYSKDFRLSAEEDDCNLLYGGFTTFDVFQKNMKEFLDKHKNCGQQCIHLKKFYDRIGYSPQVIKAGSMSLPKQNFDSIRQEDLIKTHNIK